MRASSYTCSAPGLVKIGAPVALLNTNIQGDGLLHCLESCRTEFLVYSEEMRERVQTLFSDQREKPTVKLICASEVDSSESSSERIPPGFRKSIRYSDTALYIFTSGTTGLPKAAKISHLRYFGSSLIISRMLALRSTDVLYCPLPLYHSSAMVLGLGLSFHNGIPFVFQKKFSVTNFWSTCRTNNVTIVMYIGELCRYLTTANASTDERNHCVRLAIGNGLSASVWEMFQARSGIPMIAEFYAATESNVGLVNTVGKTGAIGYLSPLLAKKHPGKLLRFDFETGQPLRDKNGGHCIECKPNEVGEFVGMINRTDPTQKFDGYSDEAETSKKLLHNVLRQGDMAYRSGDLMIKDEDGFLYFVDRIGDTIRWKGENVSTSEVEAVVRSCTDVIECSVYGISIPGYEGKAGMALVKVESMTNLPTDAVSSALAEHLPEYARPVFLRFTEDTIEITGTYKYRKQEYANQGLDSCQHVYVRLKSSREEFVEMTEEVHKSILDGTISL